MINIEMNKNIEDKLQQLEQLTMQKITNPQNLEYITTKPKRKQGFGDRDASQGFYNLTDKFIVCEKLKFRAINIDDINTSCKTYTNQNNNIHI